MSAILHQILTVPLTAMLADLPKEGIWLKRAGMHAMVTFPCLQNGAVQAVITIGIKTQAMDHLLIRKLNDLCSEITPLVMDCSKRLRTLLAPPRSQLRRFESQNDVAAACIDEMLCLEDAVMSNLWNEPAIGVGHRKSSPGTHSAARNSPHASGATKNSPAPHANPLMAFFENPSASPIPSAASMSPSDANTPRSAPRAVIPVVPSGSRSSVEVLPKPPAGAPINGPTSSWDNGGVIVSSPSAFNASAASSAQALPACYMSSRNAVDGAADTEPASLKVLLVRTSSLADGRCKRCDFDESGSPTIMCQREDI